MALKNNDQTRIREFLLGQLNEDEQQKIEERLMVDDELFEELEVSKGELVEEYCANELTQQEHSWFERHFLASPEGKERYALAVALSQIKKNVMEPPPRLSFFERLRDLFKLHPSFIAVASTAAVVVIIAAVFLSRPTGRTVIGPTLASNLTNRDQGTLPTKVTIPADAGAIKFPLSLPRDAPPGANYRAELDNKIDVKPVDVVERDGATVWVFIPVSQLPRGEYSLKLVAITGGTERELPGDYFFNVE